MSPHIRFKRIKYGFYRIYWKNSYIGECYKEMPPKGYDKTEDDVRYINQSYYEEYEDSAKLTRQIKNFVEGYWDNLDKIRTNMYMIKHSAEHRKNAESAYRQFYVK